MTVALIPADLPALVELLLRATLLLAAAWAAAAALRGGGASAAMRHSAWLLCIAALLALPFVRWFVPALQLPILPGETALPSVAAPAVPLGLTPSAAGPGGAMRPAAPFAWGAVLLAAYLVGATMLLIRIAAGRAMLARLWRDAEPPADQAWEDQLSRLAAEMRLPRPVELRIARGPAMPMTWGTLAPKLLLPAEAAAWPAEQRRLVLLHELAHAARRDSLSRSAASLACALYWFHPGVWFAARRMRMEQEHAADDRVLAAGGSAQAYARSLLGLARRIGESARPDLAATMVGACQLERRLVSITRPARRDRPTAAFASASAALAALATLIAAAGVPVSASPAFPGLREGQPPRAASAPANDRAGSIMPVRAAETSSPGVGGRSAASRAASPSEQLASPPMGRRERGSSGREGISDDREAQGAVAGAEPVQAPSPADAVQVPVYGWALPRAELKLQDRPPAAATARARLPLRTAPGDADRQARGPHWPRFLPQLTAGTSSPSLGVTSDRRLIVSISTK